MKKIKRINGNWTNEFIGNVEIRDLEDYLEEMKKLNFTHVDISYEIGYDEIGFLPYYNRFETDEEYETRLSLEQSNLNEIEQAEIALMNKLKEKYEK